MKRTKSRLIYFALPVLAATILLLVPALINGYPFVSSDTGTYIHIAFTGDNPVDRPVFYGWFIRISSLGLSLWGTAIAQSFLLAGLLFLFCLKFFPKQANPGWFAATVLFIIITTGVATFSGQIMPDIFAPVAFLSFVLLLWVAWNRWYWVVALGSLLAISTLMHPSLLLIVSIGVVSALIYSVWKSVQKLKKLVLVAVVIGCWMAHIVVNGWQTGEWTAGRGTTVFVAAKLASYGLTQPFVMSECQSDSSQLCRCLGEPPVDFNAFLWDPNNPVDCLGGFESARPTLEPVVSWFLSHPQYYDDYLWQTGKLSLVQLSTFGIGDGLWPYPDGQNVYWKIQHHLPHELDNYLAGRQQNIEWWPFDAWSEIQWWVVIVSLIILFLTLVIGSLKPHKVLIVSLFAFLILNVLASAFFSTLSHRFMARLIWLIPFIAVLLVYQLRWRNPEPAKDSTTTP